ncbi:MAG: radical SAM protein, partial [Deltaproteobacteria bacterium]|nr:radical SAM protein [Deltaproteobacteria bacterium]
MSEKGSGRPLIVPVFIPNQGCPHRCIFCHQENITSQKAEPMDMGTLQAVLDGALRSPGFDPARNPQIAFYGGTFTRLPIARIRQFLDTVGPYLAKGAFGSVRISTRPDALDDERIKLLRGYGVTTVELGVQSMDDGVLTRTRRGHTAEDTIEAVALLRRHGMQVGIQLMPGLPGDSGAVFSKTVGQVIALRPDMVRLYPTLVIEGTELAE